LTSWTVRVSTLLVETAPESAVIVFDFDGTLVSRDSFLDFFFHYCSIRPLRWLLIALLLPLALALLVTRSQRAAGSVLLFAMTAGSSTRSFVRSMQRYATSRLSQYAFEPIVAELAEHVAQGKRVVIATGSVPTLVRGFLAARNIGPLPVAGTRLNRRCGGLHAKIHCTGEVKVHELRRRFGVERWRAVYTNSFADRALLSRAHDITLVHPSRRTLLRTQQLGLRGVRLRVLRPSRNAHLIPQ
jgi:phosphatidylglycerophosphatase C